MKSIVGLFDTVADASTAIAELRNAGFTDEDISLIANDPGTPATTEDETESKDATSAGATTGAAVVGTLGVLAGMGMFLIPGIGPIIAAGPLMAGLAGAGVGGLAGGIVGSLIQVGIPDEEAAEYSEGVRRGGALVVVNAEDTMVPIATEVLKRTHALHPERAVEQDGRTASGRDG